MIMNYSSREKRALFQSSWMFYLFVDVMRGKGLHLSSDMIFSTGIFKPMFVLTTEYIISAALLITYDFCSLF